MNEPSQNINQFFEIILLVLYPTFIKCHNNLFLKTIPRRNRLQKIILEHCTSENSFFLRVTRYGCFVGA
jgi:hypothetical protein